MPAHLTVPIVLRRDVKHVWKDTIFMIMETVMLVLETVLLVTSLVTVMFAKLDITYTKMVLRVWHVSRTVVTALLTDVQTVRKAIGCARTGPCALNAMINVQIVETL